MENIIFLDIDGVLNNIQVRFNEESVNVVKDLIKKYNANSYDNFLANEWNRM